LQIKEIGKVIKHVSLITENKTKLLKQIRILGGHDREIANPGKR
jgi:hypothetical protein